jgi:hypothetical protein
LPFGDDDEAVGVNAQADAMNRQFIVMLDSLLRSGGI